MIHGKGILIVEAHNMAPGGVGNVYALDLRFEGKALLADLDEVHPTAEAVEEIDPYLRWDTSSTSADACSLLEGVAEVELPLGYVKHPTRKGISISASLDGCFWDHIQEKHGSAVILILPEGYTFSSDHSPPIKCNATGHIRLSAKEFKGRIAILFTIEPYPTVRNLKTTWHMARLGGSVSAEVQRINSLRVQPPAAPPRAPFYKRRVFWLGAGIVCLVVGWRVYENWVACGKFVDPPIVHHASRDTAHYVRDGNADRVIVFIHGIFGNAEGTWTFPPDTYWPDLIASDDKFGNPDIYVAKYDTGVGNNMNMDEVAEGLYQHFNDAGVFSRHRQVILVCHSLGGLVAQRLLLKHRNLAQKVPLIYFHGTPHTGAQIARMGSVFSDDPLLREMAPGASNDYLTTMESDWHNAGFSTVHRLCAYEKLKYKCVLIVDNLSGTRGCDNSVALSKNHVTIVKPSSSKDDSYILLRNAWLELPSEASGYNSVIAGMIVDQATYKGVGHASVVIAGRTEQYVTEDSGNFRIELEAPFPKRVTLHVTKAGFEPLDISVEPAENLLLPLHKQ